MAGPSLYSFRSVLISLLNEDLCPTPCGIWRAAEQRGVVSRDAITAGFGFGNPPCTAGWCRSRLQDFAFSAISKADASPEFLEDIFSALTRPFSDQKLEAR